MAGVRHALTLQLLPDALTVCRLDAGTAVPTWTTTSHFLSITCSALSAAEPVIALDHRSLNHLRKYAMAEERTREMQPGLADNLWRTRFFDLSLDLLCIAGFDGYYKQLNPAWQRMLGFTNEELYATPYLDIIHPDDREPTRAEVQNLAVGEDLHSFSCRMRQKQGGYRWILWSARNFRDEHLIYAIGKDITERKRAEEVQADLIGRLQTVLAEIKTLRGLLPMCAWCKKVRDDQDFWHSVEDYISARTDANFSHGICPECFSRAAKGLERKNRHE